MSRLKYSAVLTLFIVILCTMGASAERWYGVYDFRYGQSFVYEVEHVRGRTRDSGTIYLDVSRSGFDWRNVLDYEWDFGRRDTGKGTVRLGDIGAYEYILASTIVQYPDLDIHRLRLISTPFVFLTWYTDFSRADLREGRVFQTDTETFRVERVLDYRRSTWPKGGIDFGYPSKPSYPEPDTPKGGISFEGEAPPLRISVDFSWGKYVPVNSLLYEGIVYSGRDDILYLVIDPALPLPIVSVLYSGPDTYIARLVDYRSW